MAAPSTSAVAERSGGRAEGGGSKGRGGLLVIGRENVVELRRKFREERERERGVVGDVVDICWLVCVPDR